jgi:hypothetical protein
LRQEGIDVKIIFYIALTVIVIVDFFVQRKDVYFAWEGIPGFYALFGFIACMVIIFIAKTVGHKLLMKKEEYYD